MAGNILIFGKNSYAGRQFTEFAENQGRGRVVAAASADCNLLDPEATRKFLRGLPREPFSVVFFSVINKTVDNSYEGFLANLKLVRTLLDAQDEVQLESFVYISSIDVYGASPPVPITESTPLNPDSWYGLAKLNCEWMLRESGDLRCPLTVLRLPGIFGKAVNDRSVIGGLVSKGAAGKISLSGGGVAQRDYVWVNDLSRLIFTCLTNNVTGTFNVATGRSLGLNAIAYELRNILGYSFEVVSTPKSERDFDLSFDTSNLLRALPGFQFSALAEGLRSYKDKPKRAS